jgi:hypothetical protein
MLKNIASVLILASLATGVQAKQIQCPDVDLEIVEQDRSLARALRTGKIPDDVAIDKTSPKGASEGIETTKSAKEKFCDKLKPKKSNSGRNSSQHDEANPL